MIRSMTGYGRSEKQDERLRITVEVKSVNHRYLDLNIKMPRKFNPFESNIRTLVKEYTERGKVDIFITCEDYSGKDATVKYNSNIAAEYVRHMREMAEEFSLSGDITIGLLAGRQDVFTMEEASPDEDELWSLLCATAKEALQSFRDSRIKEGEALKRDLLSKLSSMEDNVSFIVERAPVIIEEYREKLREKVLELVEDVRVDESRLLMETAILADKICVDEELVRLKSHISQTKEALSTGDSVGRKLDFIAQEMNREANTILSKTTDLEISNRAIALKTEIEKIREQIQNLE